MTDLAVMRSSSVGMTRTLTQPDCVDISAAFLAPLIVRTQGNEEPNSSAAAPEPERSCARFTPERECERSRKQASDDAGPN
jgi:hypothetical protein